MSYYNDVFVVFSLGGEFTGELDYRFAGQMLPSGAIPLAIVNFNTHTYVEIINSLEPSEILEWLNLSVSEFKESVDKFILS